MTAYIVDVETSSLYGDVIELAFAEFLPINTNSSRWATASTCCERFRPTGAIDPRAAAVHRITQSDLEGCKPSSVAGVPPAEYWIGHNIMYDWERLGRPVDVKLLCTYALAKAVWPRINGYKLSELYLSLFGADHVDDLAGLHGAVTDVKLTGRVMARIMRETKATSLSQLPYLTHPDTWSKS